jgi:hypothetical protein
MKWLRPTGYALLSIGFAFFIGAHAVVSFLPNFIGYDAVYGPGNYGGPMGFAGRWINPEPRANQLVSIFRWSGLVLSFIGVYALCSAAFNDPIVKPRTKFPLARANRYELWLSVAFLWGAAVSFYRPMRVTGFLLMSTFHVLSLVCAINAALAFKRMNLLERLIIPPWLLFVVLTLPITLRNVTETFNSDR